jgi:outer membrane murein-binding lipoprotein Lpp
MGDVMGDRGPRISRTISGAPSLTVSYRLVTSAILLVAVLLGGCTSASKMGDYVPASTGGLPEGAPVRPPTPYAYPAVHEMPPPRDSPVLTSAEQQKLEDDLAAARSRAAAATGSGGKQ